MRTRTRFENGRAVISLHGRFDFNAYRTFRTSCNPPLAASDVVELELNLERVVHLDRSALGMLLLLKARAEEWNKRVVLTNCRGAVKGILEGARFDRIFSCA